MKTLHLFANTGGSHLAGSFLGWESIGSVEWDAWRAGVLAQRFPGEPIHGDIATFRPQAFGRPDLIVGGSPCQDFSLAGKREGLAGSKSRLALEQLRVVAGSGCRWHLWENVRGALSSKGGADWAAFTAAIHDIGHRFTWVLLGANMIGAPHKRDRVFLLSWPAGSAPPPAAYGMPGANAPAMEILAWARALVTDESPEFAWPAASGHWPALRGQPQFGWEPPRLAAKGPHWRGRISSLGDGWVPTQAATVWHLLVRQAHLGITSAKYTAKGPVLWPTAMAADADHGGGILGNVAKHGNHTIKRPRYAVVPGAVQTAEGALWPTATTDSISDRKKPYAQGGTPLPLPLAVTQEEGTLWPTVRSTEYKGTGPFGSKSHRYRADRSYLDATVQEEEQATGALCPEWVEALMGWPIGWTDPGEKGGGF